MSSEPEELQEQVAGCTRCNLRAGCTRVVFGEESRSKADVDGEGPGADEDRMGRPFVGKAGQLLDKILEVWAWKGLPIPILPMWLNAGRPETEFPARKKQSSVSWLYRQIELVSPKIIVLLGSTALQYLIDPQARITVMRGRWLVSKSGIKIMPTYHPAALLRDASKAACLGRF